MAPPRRDEKGRQLPTRRANGPTPRTNDFTQRHHRTAITPSDISLVMNSRHVKLTVPERVSRLQDGAAVLANCLADVALAFDSRLYARVASHLARATVELWMAGEALAERQVCS